MRLASVAFVALVALLAGCGERAPELPLPETEHLERAVGERIRETWEAASESPSGETLLEYGKVLMAHSLSSDAAVVLSAGADLGGPTEFESRYLAGHAFRLSSVDAAARAIAAALEMRDDYGPGHNALGEMLFEMERFDEAEAEFQRAWDLEPTSHALLGLARVALVRGDSAKAMRLLAQAREGAPYHGEVLVLLARAFDELGWDDKAALAAEQAARFRQPTSTFDPVVARVQDAVVSYAGLVDRAAAISVAGETERAFELLRHAASLYPERPLAHLEIGSMLYQMGDYAGALEAFDLALASNPRHSLALARRGMALSALRRGAEAEAAFRESIAIAPGQLHARRGLLWLLQARGAPGAFELARELVRDDPGNDATRVLLARMLLERSDLDAAAAHVATVLRRSPGQPDALELQRRIAGER